MTPVGELGSLPWVGGGTGYWRELYACIDSSTQEKIGNHYRFGADRNKRASKSASGHSHQVSPVCEGHRLPRHGVQDFSAQDEEYLPSHSRATTSKLLAARCAPESLMALRFSPGSMP